MFAISLKPARQHRLPLALLTLLPILANAIALSGLFNNDPTLQFIGIGQNLSPGWVPGPMTWLDPTVAYIVQPVGHLAASDWLHGVIPWWNPYSGAGMPLAAEMQTCAFFLPFVLLLHFNIGWLLLRVTLQALCGFFTYGLFIELGMARLAATLGGALFALTPIFFLSPHASMAPLPFLPLLLLGIEHAATAARARAPMGWSLIVIALAYSVYAGFPEVTYFDGLLAFLWTLWRGTTLPPSAWLRFALKISAGLLTGVALCAPLLIPFLEYLPLAFVGGHAGGGFARTHLTPALVPLQLMPDLYGVFDVLPRPPLDAVFKTDGSFVRLPGWVGLPVLALAFAALARRPATLRLVLAGWVAIWELRYLGNPQVTWALNLIPGMATSDSARFSGPAVNFALYALAAFAFDDHLRLGPLKPPRLAAILALVSILVLAAVLPVRHFIIALFASAPNEMFLALAATGFAFLALALLCVELRRPRHHRLLACLLIAGPLAGFLFPQLAGARSGSTDTAPVTWLQHHIGTSRIMSLGVLDAAFPVRYRIASLNFAAMPSPLLLVGYINTNLFTNTDMSIYRGVAPGQRDAVLENPAAYEALGVRYLVTDAGDSLSGAANFQPLDAAARNFAAPLNPGGVMTGILPFSSPFREVAGVSVFIGTYKGSARGPILASLCAGNACATGVSQTAGAADNAPLTFMFPKPLYVPPGQGLPFRLSLAYGSRVAIWLAPTSWGTELPVFTLISAQAPPPGRPKLVFHDATTSIYELPNPAPYAQTANAGCAMNILDRQNMRTTCPAPTTLLRREMFYPGWAATVNGAPVQVSQSGLFQSIPIPAGAAAVRFNYAPPHIRLACGVALLALLFWVGSGRFFKKSSAKNFCSMRDVATSRVPRSKSFFGSFFSKKEPLSF